MEGNDLLLKVVVTGHLVRVLNAAAVTVSTTSRKAPIKSKSSGSCISSRIGKGS